MTTSLGFARRKVILSLSICTIIAVAASNTYAGFEWVPQKPGATNVKPAAPQERVNASVEPVIVDDVVLPLPSDASLDEPVEIAPPAQAEVIEVAPETSVTAAAPTRIAITPKEQPNTGAVINAPAEETLPLPVLEAPQEKELTQKELRKPPFDMNNTRIVMPDDAPQSAIEQTEKNSVTITPAPSEQQLFETKMEVAPPPPAEAIQFTEAVGFAKDVPLALALRQVVPADYAFSFGPGVNPGLRTSWNGGQPWNFVVGEMVTDLGYSVVIQHKSVRIFVEGAPGVPAYIEPAAGTEEADAPIIEESAALELSSPEAGNEATIPVSRDRSIKRVGITDPGFAEEIGEQSLIPETKTPDQLIALSNSNEEPIVISAPAKIEAPITQEKPAKLSFWTAEAGASLRETLVQWSEAANADLVWDASYDYQLPADFEVQGNFEKAVDLLLKHGLGQQNNTLSYSLATSSENSNLKIVINNAAQIKFTKLNC